MAWLWPTIWCLLALAVIIGAWMDRYLPSKAKQHHLSDKQVLLNHKADLTRKKNYNASQHKDWTYKFSALQFETKKPVPKPETQYERDIRLYGGHYHLGKHAEAERALWKSLHEGENPDKLSI